ncbi:hypothetical protein WR25_19592 [Diploscapter pachys]|uniref:Uncharacterized protein n=1 Tax=Diploscapter pachys TaxID=2018661 RepID=A0A2A2LCP4_9BILA|nr:hypothetical protein WR25_19592 [Diploscapter pachys]
MFTDRPKVLSHLGFRIHIPAGFGVFVLLFRVSVGLRVQQCLVSAVLVTFFILSPAAIRVFLHHEPLFDVSVGLPVQQCLARPIPALVTSSPIAVASAVRQRRRFE